MTPTIEVVRYVEKQIQELFGSRMHPSARYHIPVSEQKKPIHGVMITDYLQVLEQYKIPG